MSKYSMVRDVYGFRKSGEEGGAERGLMRTLHLTPLCMQDFSFFTGNMESPESPSSAAAEAQFNFTKERFLNWNFFLAVFSFYCLAVRYRNVPVCLEFRPPSPPLLKHIFSQRTMEAEWKKKGKSFSHSPVGKYPAPPSSRLQKKGCSRERNGAS